jgi:hypothetical protein
LRLAIFALFVLRPRARNEIRVKQLRTTSRAPLRVQLSTYGVIDATDRLRIGNSRVFFSDATPRHRLAALLKQECIAGAGDRSYDRRCCTGSIKLRPQFIGRNGTCHLVFVLLSLFVRGE